MPQNEMGVQHKSKRRICHCENPCTDSSRGRMIYIYPEKNLRAYPGIVWDTEKWDAACQIRVNIEKSINHFKDSFCLAKRWTRNKKNTPRRPAACQDCPAAYGDRS